MKLVHIRGDINVFKCVKFKIQQNKDNKEAIKEHSLLNQNFTLQ